MYARGTLIACSSPVACSTRRSETLKGETPLSKKLSSTLVVGASALAFSVVGGAAAAPPRRRAQPTGTTFLAASNTEPAFDFMTQNFVQTANGGNSVTFSFGGSGHLAGEIDGGVDYASDGTGNSPAGYALFASADEANVDNTIPAGAAAAANPGAVPKNTVGKCVDPHSADVLFRKWRRITTARPCPGIGSTRAQYTTGRLVIFSCRSGGKTLAPAQGSPACAKPVSGYFTKSGAHRGALHHGPGVERPARPHEEVLRGHRRS